MLLGINDVKERSAQDVAIHASVFVQMLKEKLPNAAICFSETLKCGDLKIDKEVDKLNNYIRSLSGLDDRIKYTQHNRLQSDNSLYIDNVHISRSGTQVFIGDILDSILPRPAQQHPIETRPRNSKWTQRDDYGNYSNTNVKQLPPLHEGRNQMMHANHITNI